MVMIQQIQSSLYQSLLALPGCRPFKIQEGETFLVQGEQATTLYLLEQCDFHVSYLTPLGKRYIVSTQKGFTGVLGEMEVFRPDGQYIFSATARQAATGYQISRQKLLDALSTHPEMAVQFLALLSGRYAESINHTLNALLYSLRYNVVRAMLEQSALADGGWFLFDTEQYAGELGATQRAFRRVIKELVDGGFIEKKRHAYRIAKYEELEQEISDGG